MTQTARMNLFSIALFAAVFLTIGAGVPGPKEPLGPSKNDKCPVCGMFVSRYPDWLAQVVFPDGTAVFFDGPKDLFKYLFDIRKYSPKKSVKDISAILVREYYDMAPIDARKAYFVTGSDVYGPMGHELIPLANQEDARTFAEDHKGKRVHRFEEVTQGVIEALD